MRLSEQLRHKLTYSVMILMTLPFVVFVALPSQWNASSTTLYISSLAGFVGVILLIWQFALGTRAVNALLYRDLSWPLKVHKILGKWGTLAIFFHPLLVVYSYGEDLLYVFVPSFKTDFEAAVSWGRLGFAFLVVLWVSSALLRGKIKFRPWKYLHYVAYLVLPLVLLHGFYASTTLATNNFLLGYWYALALLFVCILVMRSLHIAGIGKHRFSVVENSALNDEVQLLRLRTKASKLRVQKGQYVYLQNRLLSEEHPFTVLAIDKSGTEISIAYKVVGSFTAKLRATVVPGDVLIVDGPYGFFTRELDAGLALKPIFIAGGIGITPFMAHLTSDSASENILFYANRTPQSTVFNQQLRQALGKGLINIYSQDVGKQIGAESGYITPALINKYVQKPQAHSYFICGPEQMMTMVTEDLLSMGVLRQQIFTEKFGF